MSMKYKLLLCVTVLLAISSSALLAKPALVSYRQPVTIYEQTFTPKNATLTATDPLNYTKWTYQGDWAVIDQSTTAAAPKPGVPTLTPDQPVVDSSGNPVSPPQYVHNVLVTNKNGDYAPSVSEYVVSLPIDCSKYTGVVLTFNRSLTIEDAAFDQAYVQVSTDKTTWKPAWKSAIVNPTDPSTKEHHLNLTDASWTPVSYDISAVADGQKTVYLRFGLVSNSNNTNGGTQDASVLANQLHGWGIDDIVLSGAGAAVAYSATPTGASFGAGFTATPANGLWMAGPAVGGGGQLRYNVPGDPTQGTQTVGLDPGTNAAGVPGGEVVGTVIAPVGTVTDYGTEPAGHTGGNLNLFNYPPGISPDGTSNTYADNNTYGPQYLTWGPLDLTGLQKSALQFQRWLEIGAGSLDKVSIQVHVPADDSNPLAPDTIIDNTTANTINVGTAKVVYPADTTEKFDPLAFKFQYNTTGLASGEQLTFRYTLDNSASTVVWTPFVSGSVTTNTGSGSDNTATITFDSSDFASVADYTRAQDNKNFAVSAVVEQSDHTALASGSNAAAVISEAKVTGLTWKYVWTNATASPNKEIMDTAWTPESYDLSQFGADGNSAVYVRWSIDKSDSGFYTEYGGWSLDQIQVVSNSRQWLAGKETVPSAGLIWGQQGPVSVPAKNTGTAVWDNTYSLYEVKGLTQTGIPDPGAPLAPSKTLSIVSVDSTLGPIHRWGVGSIAVGTSTAADKSYTFNPTVTAPPLTSVVYDLPVDVSAPGDASLSTLSADWDMASPTATSDVDWLSTFMGSSIANGGIVTGRFTDITPPTSRGYWAEYWIEELAGRVPMVVQGYLQPDGTSQYRPNPDPKVPGDTTGQITRDQIAVFMARAAGILPYQGTGTVFSDVPSNFWAVNEIEACFAKGIVTGYPDRTYQPSGTITRDAMAKFIANGKKVADGSFAVPPATADPFVDVPYQDDSSKGIKKNIFVDYIAALKNADIVQGYPSGTDSSGNTIWQYRPSVIVTRDQLAVYVWRAFMRDTSSVVVLGGPSITKVQLATDGVGAGNYADYYGYQVAGTPFTSGPFTGQKAYKTQLVGPTDVDYAYVTFDAVRLTGNNTKPLNVTFQLQRVTGTTGAAVAAMNQSVPAGTLNGWFGDVTASGASGEPYRNVAVQIPTGLIGDFKLVTLVDGVTMAAQPAISIRGDLGYDENFDDTSRLNFWLAYGQPTSPGPDIYPLTNAVSNPNTDLFNGAGSLELTQTQAVLQNFSTANHHNIRLGLRFAQNGKFGSTDSIKIEWSPDWGSKGDAGATWQTVATITGSNVPTKLQKNKVFYELPNGDPNADPPVIGADNNSAFTVRLSCNASSTTAKAYFDDFEIDGT